MGLTQECKRRLPAGWTDRRPPSFAAFPCVEYISLSSGPHPVAPCPVENCNRHRSAGARKCLLAESLPHIAGAPRYHYLYCHNIYSPSESDPSVRCVTERSYEFPISIPVANTSAPPNATCRAAESGGVSMKR